MSKHVFCGDKYTLFNNKGELWIIGKMKLPTGEKIRTDVPLKLNSFNTPVKFNQVSKIFRTEERDQCDDGLYLSFAVLDIDGVLKTWDPIRRITHVKSIAISDHFNGIFVLYDTNELAFGGWFANESSRDMELIELPGKGIIEEISVVDNRFYILRIDGNLEIYNLKQPRYKGNCELVSTEGMCHCRCLRGDSWISGNTIHTNPVGCSINRTCFQDVQSFVNLYFWQSIEKGPLCIRWNYVWDKRDLTGKRTLNFPMWKYVQVVEMCASPGDVEQIAVYSNGLALKCQKDGTFCELPVRFDFGSCPIKLDRRAYQDTAIYFG